MPESKRIGLIDLGSNAIRWEMVELLPPAYRSLDQERVPLRIGDEVFSTGRISAERIEQVAAVFADFARRCRDWGGQQIIAVGTAAAREASNASALQAAIAERSEINLEIISGRIECELLLKAVATVVDLDAGRSLLVDMGGGSIEVACLEAGRIGSLESHPLGALRFGLDSALLGSERLREIGLALHRRGQSLIAQLADQEFERYLAIGGNLDSIRSILAARAKLGSAGRLARISCKDLQDLLQEMVLSSPSELAERFDLGPDRADSIVPAAQTYLWVAELTGMDEIQAPGVSLRDGLIHQFLDTRASS